MGCVITSLCFSVGTPPKKKAARGGARGGGEGCGEAWKRAWGRGGGWGRVGRGAEEGGVGLAVERRATARRVGAHSRSAPAWIHMASRWRSAARAAQARWAACTRRSRLRQQHTHTHSAREHGRTWAAPGSGKARGLWAVGGRARRTQLVASEAIDAPDFELEPRPPIDPFERVVHVDRMRPHGHLLLLPRSSGARRWVLARAPRKGG